MERAHNTLKPRWGRGLLGYGSVRGLPRAVVLAPLWLFMAAGGAVGQAPPAPTTSAVHPGNGALKVVWTAPEGVTGVTAYDLRWILTSADETVDSDWTVEEDVWTEGELLYVLFGLIDGSGYDVQVRAVTDADGAWSTTVGATPAEPINVFVAAVALPLGLPVGAVLTSPDDYDLFRFTLTEETGVILSLAAPSTPWVSYTTKMPFPLTTTMTAASGASRGTSR